MAARAKQMRNRVPATAGQMRVYAGLGRSRIDPPPFFEGFEKLATSVRLWRSCSSFLCTVCRTSQDSKTAPVPWVCKGCHPFVLKLWRREVRTRGTSAPPLDDFVELLLGQLRRQVFGVPAKPKSEAKAKGEGGGFGLRTSTWFVCSICRTTQDPKDAPVPWICEGCHPFAVKLWRREVRETSAVCLDEFALNLHERLSGETSCTTCEQATRPKRSTRRSTRRRGRPVARGQGARAEKR